MDVVERPLPEIELPEPDDPVTLDEVQGWIAAEGFDPMDVVSVDFRFDDNTHAWALVSTYASRPDDKGRFADWITRRAATNVVWHPLHGFPGGPRSDSVCSATEMKVWLERLGIGWRYLRSVTLDHDGIFKRRCPSLRVERFQTDSKGHLVVVHSSFSRAIGPLDSTVGREVVCAPLQRLPSDW